MGSQSVPPIKQARPDNERQYLTLDEMERLIAVAKKIGRYPHRDSTLLLIMYRHGLRVGEAVNLQWSHVNFSSKHLYVQRLKKGSPSNQPLYGDEVRLLRQLQREYPDSPWLFISERKAPLTTRTVRDIVSRAAEEAGLGYSVHPHMIRHSTGFYLASRGYDTRKIQDYLGHRQIQHTVRYTKLAPGQFEGLWE
ncbi:tyrosine-type recombinase/integrase [Trichocoleus sp. DQ-A3]|uniref:tyrosine-type recombinase/integrase n=1 Tax=Cyanophyceae TaxID=3028117 RepID=UPI0016867ED4|nr:tyrosine-type recombinase/integrase [Coleofasciculus sp. FACHB-125]MBD1903712.1 tyrosine-type recombinase/integrase [Coleofasciculus sp. FACHB-125]